MGLEGGRGEGRRGSRGGGEGNSKGLSGKLKV